VYVGSGEDGAYYLLAEGLTEDDLVHLADRARREHSPAAEAEFEALRASHALLSVNGPYAWEVMSAACGPAILGMPYLTLMHLDDAICFRGGKTGEYGYDVLVPRESLSDFQTKLEQAGEPLDLQPVGLEALDQCALDNWHFNVRTLRDTPLATPITPLELQLQWRVSYSATFIGSGALAERRKRGIDVRATCFSASDAVKAGDVVTLDGAVAGEVFAAGWSPTCNEWVGIALLALRVAQPGIRSFRAGDEQAIVLETRTPPLVNNRSLHVDLHRHSYQSRSSDVFPPLVVR
jgi:aminomethyltransferase